MKKSLLFDVFLSHSSKDKAVARELFKKLTSDGISVWFDEVEIQPGDMIGKKIEQGLAESRILVLLMSENAFSSDWATLEGWTFRYRDPTNNNRRFVPIRIDDAEINESLRQFAWIDWRKQSADEYERLVGACRAAKEKSSEPEKLSKARNRAILLAPAEALYSLSVSEKLKLAFTGCRSGKIQAFDLRTYEKDFALTGHTGRVATINASSDGKVLVSGSHDMSVRVWDISKRAELQKLEHPAPVSSVVVSADGQLVITGCVDGVLTLWRHNGDQFELYKRVATDSPINAIAASEDGKWIAVGSQDSNISVWRLDTFRLTSVLKGHTAGVEVVAISSDSRLIASGSEDCTVRLWEFESGKLIAVLEGHTNEVRGIALSKCGHRLVSGGSDNLVLIWDTRNGSLELSIDHSHNNFKAGGIRSISLSEDGETVSFVALESHFCVWYLPPVVQKAPLAATEARYTNAKVLLIGDSGVGKTGLAHRLAEDKFEATISSDAVWATQLRLPDTDSQGSSLAQREVWLWDFAGQSDYRLIHQLFMDETALAILVFNPQSDDPFAGLGQWDQDIQRAARRSFQKLLVAGRCDRGGLTISKESILRFSAERRFADYFETSALTGLGCGELKEAIFSRIPWGDIPWTASPKVFRLLKEEIVKMKDSGKVLLRVVELQQQLQLLLPTESFSNDQLRAVVALLAGPGVVWKLEFGDFVLLQPERINSYAGAVIRSVRAHTEEIGCIDEADVLSGNLKYDGVQRLALSDEMVVLRAMHQTFVDHGLCLREHTDRGTMLIFPSYFRRERPELEKAPIVLVTYQFVGSIDEIYATLVVKLHHTSAFERDRLWRFAADFKTAAGHRLGFQLLNRAEGAAELNVYFDPGISDDVQVTFVRYVHEHLNRKARDVVRVRNYFCGHCGTSVENRKAIERRIIEGKKDILCVACEERVPLLDVLESKFASEEFLSKVREMEAEANAAIDSESRELAAEAHTMSIVAEAGQIWRRTAEPDWGIDGEIEFRDNKGLPTGRRLYVQLKSGDSYLRKRASDGAEIFTIREQRHAEYWQSQAYPVMLVIRSSDGVIRWMNVSSYLKEKTAAGIRATQVLFAGTQLTAASLRHIRRILLKSKENTSF